MNYIKRQVIKAFEFFNIRKIEEPVCGTAHSSADEKVEFEEHPKPIEADPERSHGHEWSQKELTDLLTLRDAAIDWDSYLNLLPDQVDDAIEFFFLNYMEYPLVLENRFDSDFYLVANPDVAESGINPLVHFLRYGEEEGREALPPFPAENTDEKVEFEEHSKPIEADPETSHGHEWSQKELTDLLTLRDAAIDWDSYLNILPDQVDDAIEFFFLNYMEYPLVLENRFDSDFYLTANPDVAKHKFNPLVHFLRHGEKEGRLASLQRLVVEGGNSYNPELDTIAVVSHECSATGAPAVALSLVRHFNQVCNVISISGKKGDLYDDFTEGSFLHLSDASATTTSILKTILKRLIDKYALKAMVVNSVESIKILDAAAALEIPRVLLLHEFAEYTLPKGKMSQAIEQADIVIYPARSLEDSGLAELMETRRVRKRPNHIWVQPQGHLNYHSKPCETEAKTPLRIKLGLDEHALIISGAGHVQVRKGVDWFLQTCYYIKQKLEAIDHPKSGNIHFVWLGDGYKETDLQVSVWLKAFIARTGLKDFVHFFGHVSNVYETLQQVDIFLLTSRLDPFPNVAVDALEADCGIGVFESASGFSDFVGEHDARHVAASYGDTHELANKVVEHLGWLVIKDGTNARISQTELLFSDYCNVIESAIAEAIQRNTDIQEVKKHSEVFKKKFDPDFYHLNFHGGDPQYHFLSLLYKTIIYNRPYPGCGIQEYLSEHEFDGSSSFFSHVERSMTASSVYPPIVLDNNHQSSKFHGKIAIHFHIYYRDLIEEYCQYFENLFEHDVDLFVTYSNAITKVDIYQLGKVVSGKLHLTEVQNIGRDVYPFHLQFVDNILGNYELVGHFHTKKTVFKKKDTAKEWRHFILRTMLGTTSIANQIVNEFGDKAVGLLFPEDPHAVDEAENGQAIKSLIEQFGYVQERNYFQYPLGTMFIARTEALSDLSILNSDIFKIDEPVPADGTVLHAFERLIPQIVEESGYRVLTAFNPKVHW